MEEIYKTIEEFDNYEVSNFGNVRNKKTKKGLKGGFNKTTGYLHVRLSKDGKGTTKYIHHLVAKSFIENPDDKPSIDHKDNNPLNNHVDNLRFATYQENNQNAKIRKDNKSGFKGVGEMENGKFRAYITIDGIYIHLGYFSTKEQAKDARIKRANQAFGVFTNECERLEEDEDE